MLMLTTSNAIVAIVGQCSATVKAIHDVLQKYENAPQVLERIWRETGAIENSLSAIVLSLEYSFGPDTQGASVLTAKVNSAIESCRDTIFRVGFRVRNLAAGWKHRVGVVWNEKELGMLMDELRTEQASLSMLIQTLNI